METIFNNPGLQHLAEEVFWNLNAEDLKICAQINQSCKQILQNPLFCLRKFKNLSKKNKEDWINDIQSVNNSDKGIAIISYLQWNYMDIALVDLPCYSSPLLQNDFRNRIREISNEQLSYEQDIQLVKILAPLTDNPNASDVERITPIHFAAHHGHTEIVKILAPLTNTPNAPGKYGFTPICIAALHGHSEIVKILAPLTNTPNAPPVNQVTPISFARAGGHTQVVKILASLTENPNASNSDGQTPIHEATLNGQTEMVKIIAPLTDNPNAPDNNGRTPIYLAARYGHTEIVKILAPLTKNYLNTPDKDGWTPICWAAYGQHTEIVKILTHLVVGNPNIPICMSIKCCQKYTSCSISTDTETQRILQSSPNYPRKRKASWTITKESQENM